jgi:hypothetical protein
LLPVAWECLDRTGSDNGKIVAGSPYSSHDQDWATIRRRAVFTSLCLIAAFAALAGMAVVALALMPAAGMSALALLAAPALGMVSLGAGLGAAVMALGRGRSV